MTSAAPSKPTNKTTKKPATQSLKNRLDQQLRGLAELYPDAHCELTHKNPFELIVATALSAQCTDVMVNKATPALFARFPDAKALSQGKPEEIESLIRSIGLYKNKAKNIRALAGTLVEKHGGEVPRTMEELVELAGVGRKTANVVLGNAFGIASGIVVDTHVARLSQRLGWTRSEDPVRIENELRGFIPEDRWIKLSHELIFHGRRVCKARNPACDECGLRGLCPRIGV